MRKYANMPVTLVFRLPKGKASVRSLKVFFTRNLVFAFILPFLLSCENDLRKVDLLTASDSLPVSTVKNIDLIRSVSGRVVLELTAPLLKSYEGDDPYSEFPHGLKIVFFDSLMNITSQLTAEYGISHDKQKLMEARKNVVVINNRKHEQLNTEVLTWNQNTKKIYSDKFVKITQPGKVIFGEGMQSDETFEIWEIRKPRGEIIVNE
jgi:LPS export ABC transporter protein LptC